MSIVLIGYRGSGKSSVGRLLAGRLQLPFVDTDELIVQKAGMSIKEIFEKHGEAKFRDLESVALQEACSRADHVIALGGGAVLREENRSLLERSGHRIVYLHAEPQALLVRIQSDPATRSARPSLTKLGGGIDEVRSLLQIRLPLYRQVKTDEIDVTHLSIEQVVDQIIKLIESKSN